MSKGIRFLKRAGIWAAALVIITAGSRFLPADMTQTGSGTINSRVEQAAEQPGRQVEKKPCRLIRVIDGDTIKALVDGKEESVRFIGVDTPETKASDGERAYGEKAKAYTAALLKDKSLYLTLDVGARDKYGRILAYLYTEDGTFINAELVRAGYAQVMTIPPNVKYQALFTGLQKKARADRKGLWDDQKYRLDNPLY